ncbi:MAG TPA: hypothetical protein VIA62_00245, partial [Thermoanaerobaculia bacterium]|nr:hypothetical protein [Thermoanaerobaculia bacterium]
MATTSIDYAAVLDDLRAKRDELNTAIAAIERLVGGSALSPSLAVNGETAASTTGGAEEPVSMAESKIREDSFFGLSVTGATKKYLMMVKRPVL